ncbi:Nn.00g050080.m01.CDS01 [Neocucurbitaria sp. VM-36]
MPGKRKRGDDVTSSAVANGNPLSAIAAARLRAGAAAKGITTPEITHEPVPIPSTPAPESVESGSRLLGPEEEERREEEEEEGHTSFRRKLKFCNWRNDSQDIISNTDSELTLNLNKHSTIALVGSFKFKVLRGAVNINGANISTASRAAQDNGFYHAFVPAIHPILKIRGLDGTNHIKFMSCRDPMPLARNSPLCVHNSDITPVTRSFKIITDSNADPLYHTLSPEVIPEDWIRAIEDCSTPSSITLVTGSPQSGKSTFAGRLLNRYLTGLGRNAPPVPAVCYLDLDPFKPEYTTSGQISLVVVRDIKLSPGFANPVTIPGIASSRANETIRAHPIPTSLANYADYYHLCIEDLFLAYKTIISDGTAPPLIINTPGFLYASRFDMLNELLCRFKPHNIIHLGDTQHIDTETATKLHSLRTAFSQYRSAVHEITAQAPSLDPIITEVDINAMHMQSYFHLEAGGTKSGQPQSLSWALEALSCLVPWEFCYRDTIKRSQDIVGFAMYTEPLEPAALMHALNGSIVHIVQTTSPTIPSPFTELPRTSRYRIPYFPKSERTGVVEPLDPRTSRLICTAMIRGFDPATDVVQILVPKTHEALLYSLLPERTVFIGGCADMPDWAYLEDTPTIKSIGRFGATSSGEENRHGIPWAEEPRAINSMGYLNTVRRVRKFQT